MILFERKILSELMIGRTHYVDVGDRKQISVYYPSDTEVHLRAADSTVFRGEMIMKDAGYTISWHDGTDGYYKIAEHLGAYVYIDDNGRSAGTITKIVPGNPEYL